MKRVLIPMSECSDLFVIASRSCGVAIQEPPEPILDRASPGLPRRYAPRNDEQKPAGISLHFYNRLCAFTSFCDFGNLEPQALLYL